MAATKTSYNKVIVPVIDTTPEETIREVSTVEDNDREIENDSNPIDSQAPGHVVHRETLTVNRSHHTQLSQDVNHEKKSQKRSIVEEDSVFSAFHNAVDSGEYEENVKYETGWRLRLKEFMLTPGFTVVVMILTLYAVLGLSISEAACGYKDFDALTALTLVSMVFFSFELIALCLCNKDYYKTFYFWLDFIGTVSLWPDVKWIWPGPPIDGLAVARAARIARAGTKAVRAVRFFRVLRLVRVIRVLKFVKIASRSMGGPAKGSDGDNVGTGASKIARSHAETVEMRVVIGVILILMVVTNLEYSAHDMSVEVGLKTIRNLYERHSDEAVWQSAAKVFENKVITLVFLRVGSNIFYDSTDNVIYSDNIVYTERRIYGSVYAGFDVTDEIKQRALYDILLALFLMLLFISGAYIFNRDATQMVVVPLSKLSERITTIASQLFGIQLKASETMNDSAALESILTKIVRVFQTNHHKITTLFNKSTIWTITVHKEKEKALSSGVGTSHRLDLKGVKTLSSHQANAQKRSQVRNFMFANFINDPVAFKHFEAFLTEHNPTFCKHLHFWEEVQRYKRSSRDTLQLAEQIDSGYVDPQSKDAISFPGDVVSQTRSVVSTKNVNPETFSAATKFAEDILRSEVFTQFVENTICMSELERAKSGTQKSIMFENEYDGGVFT